MDVENDGKPPEVVQPDVTPFTALIKDLPNEKFLVQFYMPTGVVVLFMDKDELKNIGQMFIRHATGIILPSEG